MEVEVGWRLSSVGSGGAKYQGTTYYGTTHHGTILTTALLPTARLASALLTMAILLDGRDQARAGSSPLAAVESCGVRRGRIPVGRRIPGSRRIVVRIPRGVGGSVA